MSLRKAIDKEPSPDTDFKIRLTNWIERKKWFAMKEKILASTKTLEAWREVSLDHEEGEG